MSRGKYLSLEEARQQEKLDQFVKEHPNEGDQEAFNALMKGMAHGDRPTSAKKATSRTGKP